MHMTCWRPKSQKTHTGTIQDFTDHVNKLPCNEELRRRQEIWCFRGSEIKMLRNVRDGFFQGQHGLVDALHMACFLIPESDIIEHVDRSGSMLLRIKHGEPANADIDLQPRRNL